MKRSLAIAFCLLVVLGASGAFAQPPQPLDILGVQLGMSRESAVQLLQSRQPPYNVTSSQALTVEDLGTSVWDISLNSPPPNSDIIYLSFAPPPTKSTVLRIHRTVSYIVDYSNNKTNANAPSVDTFVRSLAEKFRSPTPTLVESSSPNSGVFNTSHYVWTRAGEFLSSAELNRRLRYPARCISTAKNTPRQLSNTNVGYNFHLQFDDKNFEETCGTVASISWAQQGGIITNFDMTLFDSAGLVLAFTKSALTIDAKKGSQHQQELERAKQIRPPL
jgi:hypothetical protein